MPHLDIGTSSKDLPFKKMDVCTSLSGINIVTIDNIDLQSHRSSLVILKKDECKIQYTKCQKRCFGLKLQTNIFMMKGRRKKCMDSVVDDTCLQMRIYERCL